MFKNTDRALGWLLVLGAVLHAFGALKAYEPQTPLLVWSLAGSLAAALLAAINLMRIGRPSDHMLAWVSLVGSLCWAAIALAFGLSVGNLLDPRALYHAVVALGLAAFSAEAVLRR